MRHIFVHFIFKFTSIFNLVRVGIDVALRRIVIAITWFHQRKSNANHLIIFDVICNHVEVIPFIYFVYITIKVLTIVI